MEKILKILQRELKKSFEKVSQIKEYDSLLEEILNESLSWQKKKTESLFEDASLSETELEEYELEEYELEEALANDWIHKCYKPTKKNQYFLSLVGLYKYENGRSSKLDVNLMKILQSHLYPEMKWTINDEERVIIIILILCDAFEKEDSLSIDKLKVENKESNFWEYIKDKIMPKLHEIGLCNSFETKIENNNTKYQSLKNFFSHLANLSRSSLCIPDGGAYYLNCESIEEKKFLIDLLCGDKEFKTRIELLNAISNFGRELYIDNFLNEQFELNKEFKDLIEG